MAVVQYGPGWWFPRWWFERHKAVDDRVVKSHRAVPVVERADLFFFTYSTFGVKM